MPQEWLTMPQEWLNTLNRAPSHTPIHISHKTPTPAQTKKARLKDFHF